MRLSFTKMQAAGNDYIYVDGVERRLPDADWAALARRLSRRRHSVGADGIILVLPSESADFRMRLFNADGSEGDMCGNGVRCLAAFVWEMGFIGVDTFSVETMDGKVWVNVSPRDGELFVEAEMNSPKFSRSDIPMDGDPDSCGLDSTLEVMGRTLPIDALRVGNPHCVVFVREVDEIDLETLGPIIEEHPLFPEKCNVEFVQVVDRNAVNARVWERGSGITLSCGTGASAVAVSAIRRGRCDTPVAVNMPGGILHVDWDGGDALRLSGVVSEVYRGSVDILPGEIREGAGHAEGGQSG